MNETNMQLNHDQNEALHAIRYSGYLEYFCNFLEKIIRSNLLVTWDLYSTYHFQHFFPLTLFSVGFPSMVFRMHPKSDHFHRFACHIASLNDRLYTHYSTHRKNENIFGIVRLMRIICSYFGCSDIMD